MKHPFRVGQKVICINDWFHPVIVEWGDEYPRLNHVYTVKSVSFGWHGVTGIYGPSVLVNELNNPGDQLHFCAYHFRPLTVEDKKIQKLLRQVFGVPRKSKAIPQAVPVYSRGVRRTISLWNQHQRWVRAN